MSQSTAAGIAASAFLVNELRARKPELSLDRFAHLWVNAETLKISQNYDEEVYPDDAIALGIRNRFFLKRIERFQQQHRDATILNIGSGFTNYPFLVESPLNFIEVDFPHVVDFKARTVEEFVASGRLPPREIQFLGCDLREESERKQLEKNLASQLAGSPSLFVMEGVTYYLPSEALMELFGIAERNQISGSQLVFDYWPPELATQKTCTRFREYLSKRLGYTNRSYSYLTAEWISNRSGYRVDELTDVLRKQTEYELAPKLTAEYGVLDAYASLTRI